MHSDLVFVCNNCAREWTYEEIRDNFMGFETCAERDGSWIQTCIECDGEPRKKMTVQEEKRLQENAEIHNLVGEWSQFVSVEGEEEFERGFDSMIELS